MATQKPSLGASLGSFVATIVDATLSHCEAHKGTIAGKGTQPGGTCGTVVSGGHVPDASAETSFAVGVRLGCAPGSTGVPGETMVKLYVPTTYPNGLSLGPPKMTPVPPGVAAPSSSHPATAPTHAAAGVNTLRVAISPTLPRGLYLGELRAMLTTGAAGPRCPVVIYLDGLP